MAEKTELKQFYKSKSIEFDKIWDSIKSKAPEHLYHYTNLSSIVSIINNEALYVSNCQFLNDSSEIKYLKNIIESVLENENDLYKIDSSDNFKKQFIQTITQSFEAHIDILSKNMFILSFSDSDHSTSIWNTYAENDGYRLKFDFKIIHNEFMSTGKHNIYINSNRETKIVETYTYSNQVIYDETMQYDFVKKYLIAFSDIFYHCAGIRFTDKKLTEWNNQKIIGLLTDLFYFGCICKDPCFRHEQEHRIVIVFDHETNERLIYEKYRQSKSSIIPYIELDFRMPIKMPLREIEIGPKINIDIAEKGLERFISNTKYSDVKVTRSKIPIRF